jgi:hypothetical protein
VFQQFLFFFFSCARVRVCLFIYFLKKTKKIIS